MSYTEGCCCTVGSVAFQKRYWEGGLVVGESSGDASYFEEDGCYDTAGSSSSTRVGGAYAILGKILSHMDLVFSRSFGVRSVQQLKVTPWVLSDSLKGLILK